jgi:hypothetical protein
MDEVFAIDTINFDDEYVAYPYEAKNVNRKIRKP